VNESLDGGYQTKIKFDSYIDAETNEKVAFFSTNRLQNFVNPVIEGY
jgi:hypothetical protein